MTSLHMPADLGIARPAGGAHRDIGIVARLDHNRREETAMTPRDKRACIVGAGPAGTAAAEGLRAAGIAFDLYDENARPGGNIGRRGRAAPVTPLEQMIHGTADRLRL